MKNTIILDGRKNNCVRKMLRKLVGKKERKNYGRLKFLSKNPTKKIKLARKLTRGKKKKYVSELIVKEREINEVREKDLYV